MNIEKEFLDITYEDKWDDVYEQVKENSDFHLDFSIAQLSHNKDRNRYSNVLPYDHNRISLLKPCSYMNDKNIDEKSSEFKLNLINDSNYRNHKLKSKWFRRNSHKLKNMRFSTPNMSRKSNQSVDTFNDYINASLVQFSCSPYSSHNLSYILTQGPLSNTTSHFWLMVWQQNSHCIIMLNKIIERNSVKCHTYFPGSLNYEPDLSLKPQSNEDTSTNDNELWIKPRKKEDFIMEFFDVGLQVIFLRRECKPYYIITIFELKELMTGNCREVWHFQYTAWPDFGVPKDYASIIEFIEHINRYLKTLYDDKPFGPSPQLISPNIRMTLTDPNVIITNQNSEISKDNLLSPIISLNDTLMTECDASNQIGPPVVHCSAGIGRTGTYCLINFCINKLKSGLDMGVTPTIDIIDTLIEMRKFRAGLVQTSEQLQFAFGVIVEVYKRLCAQRCEYSPDLTSDEPSLATKQASSSPQVNNGNDIFHQTPNHPIPPLAYMDEEDLSSQNSPTRDDTREIDFETNLLKAKVTAGNHYANISESPLFVRSSFEGEDQETAL